MGGTVVTYTGFTYEQLLSLASQNPAITKLLSLTDLLIDGPYVEDLRDMESLRFRGSTNQRLLTPAEATQAQAPFHSFQDIEPARPALHPAAGLTPYQESGPALYPTSDPAALRPS